ncbi:polyphosphate kinase 2 [Microvirga sp. 2MCAF35]|uniref:polyphosphate kinase 2 n=1 Tax=Microvirga sp. 2MCAF35 TaxID=3232987 RepID=UPI003F98D493
MKHSSDVVHEMKHQQPSKKERAKVEAAVAGDDRGRMKRKEFESELRTLQVELARLQTWVKATGAKIVVIFEGRDTAGKGGVISRITQRVSPRVFRHVALPAPTERERSQLYVQRYIAQFPAAGEIVLFDRSWYNRAGVERVMGFCTNDEYERFMRLVPPFEREIIDNGIILLKYFLDVSQDEQRRRFADRINDPMKHWKLSPMDTESVRRWWDYTLAYQDMLRGTDTPHAPWYLVPSDDKRRARLNLIAHMLSQIPYKKVKVDLPKVPKAEPRPKRAENGLPAKTIVPARY